MSASEKAKIALLLPDLSGGGAERVNLLLAEEFVRRGYSVTVLVMADAGQLKAIVPEGAALVSMNCHRVRSAVLPLARFLRVHKPDVLVANMWPLTVAAVAAGQLAQFKRRIVVVDHGILSRQYATWGRITQAFLKWTVAYFYPRADVRIAVSEGVADDLSNLSGLPRALFQVIHNAVKVPVRPNASALAKAANLWSSSHGRRVLAVGSLRPVKNFPLLVEAFKIFKENDEDRLIILGEGPERSNIEELVKKHGLEGQVQLPGFVVDPSIYYHTAHLFVLSSDHEGLSNVLVEALGSGLRIVSTDCESGPREVLGGGRYGKLVAVGNAEALAQGMTEAFARPTPDDEELRSRANVFAPTAVADQYLEALFPVRKQQ